jgi:hypothetical protein
MDWAEACRILGVSETATDTEIKEQYLYKAQLLHPDKNQDKPENIQKKAEAELSIINQAYSIINNPINNPYRIPPKLAVEPMGIRFKDISIGERKVSTFTIRNVGGPYTSIWIENKPAPWLTVMGVKSITSERLPLEVALECTGIGEPGQQYSCNLPIKLENENVHTIDQIAVKIELNTKFESAKFGIEKESKIAAIKTNATVHPDKYVTQPVQKNKIGFSLKAFLVNFLAFAILGIGLVFLVRTFMRFDGAILMIGLILYAAIAFGVSLNHSITIGSKTNIKN